MSNGNLTVTILRDGLPAAFCTEADELGAMHRLTSVSYDHATRYEGYSVEHDPRITAAWQSFKTMTERRGYGVAGSLARLAVSIADLVEQHEKEYDSTPGQWRDYVAAPPIAAMLSAFVESLSSTGKDAGSFDLLRGKLYDWAEAMATRIGESI